MQELCDEFPIHLQQLVMTHSEVPLLLKLHVLPQPLQEATLHAAFPSITATSSLTVPPLLHDNQYVSQFWLLVGCMTTLQHLWRVLERASTP